MTEHETEAMRTEEGFKDFTAGKLRALEKRMTELSLSLSTILEESSAVTKRRLDHGDARMGRIETSLQQNTDATVEMKKDTKEILDVVNALKGGKTIAGWLGKIAKWAAGLAVAWTAIASALHGEIKLPWQ